MKPVFVTKVDDRAWQKLLAQSVKLDRAHVRVGVLASKGGDAVHESDEGPITMIELAAIHEFGSPSAGIPERSFIRRTFVEQSGPLAALCAKLAKAVVTENMGFERALALLGQWGVAAVKKTVTDGEGVPPPLADSTKKAKGSSRPLVDTGRMLGAVTYEVVTADVDHQEPAR